MDAHETADQRAEQSDQLPGCVVTPGVTFEVGTDVTEARELCADVSGARVHVEVQMPDRRVLVVFGSLRSSFLMLWMSDPHEAIEVGGMIVKAGNQLARELVNPEAGNA